jgi:hypothetical protein
LQGREINPARYMARRIFRCGIRWQATTTFILLIFEKQKKQGAAGITTAAPHVAGQWGRGDNRLPR